MFESERLNIIVILVGYAPILLDLLNYRSGMLCAIWYYGTTVYDYDTANPSYDTYTITLFLCFFTYLLFNTLILTNYE